MAKRFIVDEKDIKYIDEDNFEIFGKEVKHIQVLRFNIKDKISINNYLCTILEMKKGSIVLKKDSILEKNGEPNIYCTLYVALLKNEKLDYVVQKATELGVKEIVPFTSKNVIVKLDEKSKIKRVNKLQIIANEACKQCNRTDIVKVNDIISFDELLTNINKNDLNIFAYENEKRGIKELLNLKEYNNVKKISCIIGPEGGFDVKEVEKLAKVENTLTVSLGQRILRADTAAVNLISILMYEFEK